MNNTYKNFLKEYKGITSDTSDVLSEEINLNLKGGDQSLFPNFIAKKNMSFLRQEGKELLLDVQSTENTILSKLDNKVSESEYFVSNNNKTISDEKKSESSEIISESNEDEKNSESSEIYIHR